MPDTATSRCRSLQSSSAAPARPANTLRVVSQTSAKTSAQLLAAANIDSAPAQVGTCSPARAGTASRRVSRGVVVPRV